jgi:NADH dehydrogenase
LARLMARVMQTTAWLGIKPMLTVDQVRLLERDNVVSPGARGFHELGVAPTAMEAILDSYLYSYRRHGQYAHLAEPTGVGARDGDHLDA